DFADPSTLPDAFKGATNLLLVSSNVASSGGDPLVQHRAVASAARAAGVKHILYTSHMGASARSAFPPMRDHAATEKMLSDSGLAWTALRNGFYANSAIQMLGNAFETGIVAAPQDGKVAWTAHDDLAQAAAAILAGVETFDGPTPPLTAQAASDFTEIAAFASELTGRKITRKTLTDADLSASMTARGVPAHVIPIALGLYLAARAGEFAMTDPTLERLIGHPPLTIFEVLKQHLAPAASSVLPLI
ncbi:MAG: NAD(P)H-binding protein, partial [Deltaproteobacteria bacterium]